MRVVVVGAGIGGLTAAGLLHRAGHEVHLLEKGSALAEVGAGIQIAPNASRVIAALGLAEELARIGTTADRIVYRRWADDSEIMSIPVGHAHVERYGHPYYNVYRPDLIQILMSAVEGVDVRLDATVVEASNLDGGGAMVELASGETLDGDVVIAADGIHSAVRTSVYGEMAARFSGWIAYRALVPRERVPDLAIEITNRLGPGRHLVSYFVGRDQRYLNLVCVVPEEAWDLESWTEPGELSDLRAFFADWSPACQAVLDHVEEPVYRWALYDREPLQRWTTGRISLLGDACHPMVPFMAQGACMAIEDGAILTRCLDHDASTTTPSDATSRSASREPRGSRTGRGTTAPSSTWPTDPSSRPATIALPPGASAATKRWPASIRSRATMRSRPVSIRRTRSDRGAVTTTRPLDAGVDTRRPVDRSAQPDRSADRVLAAPPSPIDPV